MKSNYEPLYNYLKSLNYKVFKFGTVETLTYPSIGLSIDYNVNIKDVNSWRNTITISYYVNEINELLLNKLLSDLNDYSEIPETDDISIESLAFSVDSEKDKGVYTINIEELVRF